MNSSPDENTKHAWDTVIRELVAKGEVSEDVLYDSDTIIRWWRSLNPTKQEEIKSRVEELSQGVFAEVPEKKAITKIEKTWKPTVAAILMWISIISGMAISGITYHIGIPRTLSVIILVILPMFGGYYTLRRRRYNWAFTGSICSILSMPLLGIPAVILLTNSKREFHSDEKTEKKHRQSLRPRPLFVVSALVILVLVISLVVYALISTPASEPSLEPAPPTSTQTPTEPTSPVEQEEQEVEEGWVRLRIVDVGSIDYPTDFLELQSGEHRDMATEFFKVFIIEQSDFTLQQVGLNELEPSALKEYRRVLFSTDILKPGEEVYKANEKYTASPQELAEFKNMLIDQLLQGFAEMETKGVNNKIIDPGSIEIVEVNGMFPLLHIYKRQLNGNPIVLSKTYLFGDYDKIHTLIFSCRVVDEEECRDIYNKILDSFRLE